MSLSPRASRLTLISHVGLLQHIAHVQKNAFSNYEKGPLFSETMKQVLGQGIFVVDGHPWQYVGPSFPVCAFPVSSQVPLDRRLQRKATSKIFTANNFKGIITASIQEHVRRLVSVIGEHADRNEEFDLSDLFFRFTLDSFTEMAFGKSTRSLETSEPVPFAVAFDYAQGVMDRRFNKYAPAPRPVRRTRGFLEMLTAGNYTTQSVLVARGTL